MISSKQNTLFLRSRNVAGLALFAAISLTATGCGGDTNDATGSKNTQAEEMTEITVGHLPIASAAPVLYGVENGFFEEEGLDVTLEIAQGGAALVPAVASGQYDFGYSNNLSLLVAHGKGLPVRIVHTANGSGHPPNEANDALMVSESSGITSLEELEGKTVAVNALNNVPQLGVMSALEKAGADPESVTFVEIGYPNMGLALEKGRVDAAVMDEPFVTTDARSGSVSLASPYRSISEDLPLSSWFTSESVIQNSPETVEKFYRAVEKSNQYAVEDLKEIKEFVPSYLEIDEDLAPSMNLADFPSGTPDLEMLEMISQKAAEFGLIPNEIENIDELVHEYEK